MDNGDLFHKYLDICNKALDANRERFPFKQILGAARDQATAARKVEVCIVDDRPRASFVIGIEKDKITGEPKGSCEEACQNCRCNRQWHVARSYLEAVVKNPQTYIDNPARIDWEWLYNTEVQE